MQAATIEQANLNYENEAILTATQEGKELGVDFDSIFIDYCETWDDKVLSDTLQFSPSEIKSALAHVTVALSKAGLTINISDLVRDALLANVIKREYKF